MSFYRQIRPLFQEHCQGCHQPAKAGGKLVITSHAELLKGGKSEEAAIAPGKPEESLLFIEITPQDGKPPKMPKDHDPLGAGKVELIRRWIAEGAKDDTPESEKDDFSTAKPPAYHAPPVITSLDFSGDGKWLAVSGYHEVLLFNADGSGPVARLVGLSERVESVAFSPDSALLAVTGGSPARLGEVQIWNLEKRSLQLSVPVTFDTVYGAGWSSDGTLISFGCADNTARAIEAKTGNQVFFNGAHSDWVLDTVFSTDASHLVTVSRDRSMKLMQVRTQQFIDNISSITPGALKGGLIAIDRHPKKDELLIGGADGVPKIYKMYRDKARQIGDDFNFIRQFEPLPGRIFSVEYSPDGSRIAVGSSLDGNGEARIYQEADAKPVASLKVETGAIFTVTFSPDGKIAAVGGFDGFIRYMEADTGKLLKQFLPVPLSL